MWRQTFVRDISSELALSLGTVPKVLHGNLHMRRLPGGYRTNWQTFRKHAWLTLPPTCSISLSQIARHVWPVWSCEMKLGNIGPENQRHLVCKPAFQSKKMVFWIFFSIIKGFLKQMFWQRSKIYTKIALPKVVQEMENQHPTTGTESVLIQPQ